MCKIVIRNAGMKQDDIARVLNVSQNVVSKPLKEHRENGSITKMKRSRLILECKELLLEHYGTWCISDDHMIQLKLVTGTFNSQKYQDEILESGVRSPLDSLDDQNIVLRDEIARPPCTRIIKEYKNQQNTASLPWTSLLPDLNPIEHVWDKFS